MSVTRVVAFACQCAVCEEFAPVSGVVAAKGNEQLQAAQPVEQRAINDALAMKWVTLHGRYVCAACSHTIARKVAEGAPPAAALGSYSSKRGAA